MSTAARAAQKFRRLVKRGTTPGEALRETLGTYPAGTREHQGTVYAWFQDDSFFRIWRGDAYVLTHHTQRTRAQKYILDIHAHCNQCGEELWCNLDGKTQEKHRFELPGQTVLVCDRCQRDLVVRALVGE